MTGCFVRISRDGFYQNLDITELTDQELADFFRDKDRGRLESWAITLTRWIRDNVKQSYLRD